MKFRTDSEKSLWLTCVESLTKSGIFTEVIADTADALVAAYRERCEPENPENPGVKSEDDPSLPSQIEALAKERASMSSPTPPSPCTSDWEALESLLGREPCPDEQDCFRFHYKAEKPAPESAKKPEEKPPLGDNYYDEVKKFLRAAGSCLNCFTVGDKAWALGRVVPFNMTRATRELEVCQGLQRNVARAVILLALEYQSRLCAKPEPNEKTGAIRELAKTCAEIAIERWLLTATPHITEVQFQTCAADRGALNRLVGQQASHDEAMLFESVFREAMLQQRAEHKL